MATAVQKASALAEKRMVAIERRNEHTIHHDVSAKFISTRVYMQCVIPSTQLWVQCSLDAHGLPLSPCRHAPKGHGLICHRAIWEICRVAGIHDLIANVRGSVTPANVCRATFMCFEKQSQNLLLERTVASNLMALEYSSLQLMPSVAVTAPPQSVSKLDAAEPRVVLPTNEVRPLPLYRASERNLFLTPWVLVADPRNHSQLAANVSAEANRKEFRVCAADSARTFGQAGQGD